MVVQKKKQTLLFTKLIRDLKENWKSFLSVFFICFLSVTLYVGIDSAWRGMDKNLTQQFNQSNLANIWIDGELTSHTIDQIKALPGITGAQRRTKVRGTVTSLGNDPAIDLYTNEQEYLINRPIVFEGEELGPYSKNLCIINEEFAKTYQLSLGDTLTLTVFNTPLEVIIVGIGHSAEYTLYNDGINYRANPEDFAYAFVSPQTLSFLPFNQGVVTIDPTFDELETKKNLSLILDDSSKNLSVRKDFLNLKLSIEEVEQIRALGSVFPIVFFLVAALITWSTMKRLVDKQRSQIGTLLSIGYSKKSLYRHYISFGFFISIISSVLGLAAGVLGIGNIILTMLTSFYILPFSAPYLHIGVALIALALMVFITSGACYLSSKNALRETPSSLLRPKAPPPGKGIFLERITFLWKRFTYNQKLILRNMFLNKSRVLIGIIGITGCVTLLLTGFGMRDSVAYVIDHYYSETLRFDARVTLDQNLSPNYQQAIARRANAQYYEGMMSTSCQIETGDLLKTEPLFVLEDQHSLMHLEDGQGNQVQLPKHGVALTTTSAKDYGLAVGDEVTLQIGSYKKITLPVASIVSMDLGQGIYLSRSYWNLLDLGPFIPTSLMLKGDSLTLSGLDEMEGIYEVQTIEEERNSSGMVVEVLNLVVVIFVFFSGSLAGVVLYTLAQLNFYERQRELATLMVLGYYPYETKKLILTENILISLLATPIGLILGPLLHEWVLSSGLPKIFQFTPYISTFSWILTPIFTLVFALIVNIIIGGKFKEIQMVEALKSVE